MTRHFTAVGLLILWIASLGSAPAAAAPAAAHAAAPRKAAGPPVKIKILTFVTLQTAGVLKIQWQDRKGNPTKGPTEGTLSYRTNITRPRTGSLPLSRGKWKPKQKAVVFMGIAPRQRYVCPPRSYWIRVTVKVGRKRYRAFFRKKFACI